MAIMAFGPGTDEKLIRRFHEAYRKSAHRAGDTPYGIEEFRHHLDTGHIIVCVLIDDGYAVATFGVELMRDEFGPYQQYLFFFGHALENLDQIVAASFAIWRMHANRSGFSGEGRMRIAGRRGWKRVLESLRLHYDEDEDGLWVNEWQEAFGYARGRKH